MKISDYGLHWFRRDLKVKGNPALTANLNKHQGRVLGFFCFDHVFLARKDFSVNRFQFFLHTLKELKAELNREGGDLLVLDSGPLFAYEQLFSSLKQKTISLPKTVSWNRDYEPFAIDRDRKMLHWFQQHGIASLVERDHLIIEPQEIYKGEDPSSTYQVFTPFKKKWLEKFETDEVQSRLKTTRSIPFQMTWRDLFPGQAQLTDVLEAYIKNNQQRVTVPIPLAGTYAGIKAIELFKSKVNNYGKQRDIPSAAGTSRFSLFFKNGSLTTSQVIREMGLQNKSCWTEGQEKFVSEIIWREFYYYILARHPRVEKEAFVEKYKEIKWKNNEEWFVAWKEGKTGFPIVDAGMRELNQTGWMHNRLRMIVASFLTKDLHIDWRWGEQYFMEKLLDGDLAPNNGGWQWAASTGSDPQPYFRVFNPYLQSQKFDPEGAYIKTYIPELRHCNAKTIHEPPCDLMNRDYPAPMVDHSIQRQEALVLYKFLGGD